MKKYFGIAFLLLSLAACNKVVTDIQPVEDPTPESKTEVITITAKLGPKTKAGDTKAVADNGDGKITVSWEVDEHLAILYEAGGVKKLSDARITEVDAVTGSATIVFAVEGAENDIPCTIVYPLTAAKDDYTGVKDAATLLAVQDGTLSPALDVRVGEGSIQTTEPGLTVTTQPVAQFAIFKFTLRNAAGSTALSANPLTVTIDGNDYTVTPAEPTDVLYAALPAVTEEKVSFDAVDSGSKTYLFTSPSVTFTAGKYYQSTLRMREYVAMGDGLKWAVCNVGAENPWDYGDYFAWGATEPYYAEGHSQDNPCSDWKDGKTGYNWASYPFMQEGRSNWKYITKYTYADGHTEAIWYDGEGEFIGDGKTDFADYDFVDDAARVNWGSTWRMPTIEEWRTLLDDTKFTWEGTDDYLGDSSKHVGCIVTSQVPGYEGNQIFLPAAGGRDSLDLINAGSYGYYWSSSLGMNSGAGNSSTYAYQMAFLYNFIKSSGNGVGFRDGGRSVRPVTE